LQFQQYGCSERIHNACFPRIYVVFQNAPLYRKKCQKENDSFFYRFPFDTPFSAFFGFSAGFKAVLRSNRFPIARFPRIYDIARV
jgi:hypothetical protein